MTNHEKEKLKIIEEILEDLKNIVQTEKKKKGAQQPP